MTIENDKNDRRARELGFTVVDHPKGRRHAHSSYTYGVFHVWQINGMESGLWWRVAALVGGKYRDHRSHEIIQDALRDARDASDARESVVI